MTETPTIGSDDGTRNITPNIDQVLKHIKSPISKKANGEKVKNLSSKKKTKLEKVDQVQVVPRGRPKSGRPWKEPKKKFSSIKTSIHRRTFHKKMEYRNEIKHIKELSTSIKEAKKQEKVLKNQRRVENAERRLANERKAEIVQIIKNPAKLKRLRKKQMRQIEKRDLDKIKIV